MIWKFSNGSSLTFGTNSEGDENMDIRMMGEDESVDMDEASKLERELQDDTIEEDADAEPDSDIDEDDDIEEVEGSEEIEGD